MTDSFCLSLNENKLKIYDENVTNIYKDREEPLAHYNVMSSGGVAFVFITNFILPNPT
jgi:hypothetical protein